MARQFAAEHAIDVVETWTKALVKGLVTVAAADVAVGTIGFVHQRLRASGATPPPPNDYPEPVREFLRRDVVRMMLRDAKDRLDRNRRPLFVKPAETFKRFTGFVTVDAMDWHFNGASARTPVWVSTPVEFVSEWRIYSADGDVTALGSDPANPPAAAPPDPDVIREIAQRLNQMPDGYAGVTFDVGVLIDGQTALVEVNEGYGFGAYRGCTPEAVWAVNAARQQQIIKAAASASAWPHAMR